MSNLAPTLANLQPADVTTSQWIEAYTAHLEMVAEAAASPLLKRELTKAAEHARADARADGTEDNIRIMQQQEHVLATSGVGRINMEALNLVRQLWREVAGAVKTAGFCLSLDIQCEQKPSGEWSFEQAGSRLRMPDQMGQVFLAFVKFVSTRSEESQESPNEYVKRILAQQGVTKENWHQHVGRFTGLRDPWADERAAPDIGKILLP